MKWAKIQAIENELLNSEFSTYFNVTVNNNIFVNGSYVCINLATMFNSWYFPVFTDDSTIQNLISLWQTYIKEWQHSIDKMYEALYSVYNPLHNYDMTENESVGRKIDKTVTTPTGTTTQTSKSTTFDDTTYRDVEEITNSVNMTTEVTPNNTQTIDNIEGNFNNAEIRKMSRSGNIGVTTSQQMIESEIELRKKSIADYLIEFFVRKYMYTVGVDNEY